jgi:hypothetical protein
LCLVCASPHCLSLKTTQVSRQKYSQK